MMARNRQWFRAITVFCVAVGGFAACRAMRVGGPRELAGYASSRLCVLVECVYWWNACAGGSGIMRADGPGTVRGEAMR